MSDISPLKHLINLQELDLDGNPDSDISPLKKLKNLKKLYLRGTHVKENAVDELQKSLPKCKIIYGDGAPYID